jgi:uncharacterized protein (DUF1810 family)
MATAARLDHFVAAQDGVYEQVLRELKAGRKRSHWMWFIFPQLAGLGSSPMSQRFAISSLEEARGYLAHEVLGPRLRECTRLTLEHADRDINSILGYPDDLKFRSSMTLFAAAAPHEPLFTETLQKFFGGERDPLTLGLLAQSHRNGP